jgi:hypothetical protein
MDENSGIAKGESPARLFDGSAILQLRGGIARMLM